MKVSSNITNPVVLRFKKGFTKIKLPENSNPMAFIKEAINVDSFSSSNLDKKALPFLAKNLARKAKNGVAKTAKGVFDEDFYMKYIASSEKLPEILKTNSKKENLKFFTEVGKLTLIFGGLVVATAIPVPATGALYAASIPKFRKLASRLTTIFKSK